MPHTFTFDDFCEPCITAQWCALRGGCLAERLPSERDHQVAASGVGSTPLREKIEKLIVRMRENAERTEAIARANAGHSATYSAAMGSATASRSYADQLEDLLVEYERCICESPGDNAACPVDHDQIQHEVDGLFVVSLVDRKRGVIQVEHVCDDTCPANEYHNRTGAPVLPASPDQEA